MQKARNYMGRRKKEDYTIWYEEGEKQQWLNVLKAGKEMRNDGIY